jgi:hypothetical protein
MITKKQLQKEIKEMEKLAEVFAKNKYSSNTIGGYQVRGEDAIQELSNFALDYDRKVAVLDYIEEIEEKK